jgi:hypothetical protein
LLIIARGGPIANGLSNIVKLQNMEESNPGFDFQIQ